MRSEGKPPKPAKLPKAPRPPRQAPQRDKPVQGWSRSKFGQAGRGRSGQ